MSGLLSVPVALPLAGAAFVALTDSWTPRPVKDLPAILITSNPSSMTRERAGQAGVVIIEKPLLGNTLSDAIREALDSEP